jgi:hypothetical protein
MKTLTAYDKFVSKVNALDTSRGVNPDIRQFIFIFNEEIYKWIEDRQEEDSGNARIEGLQELLIPYRPLSKEPRRTDVSYVSFILPDDFFIREEAVVEVQHTRRKCGASFRIEIVKPKEVQTRLTSIFHEPSYDMEQALGFIASGHLNVFPAKDYAVMNSQLSYYMMPSEVDLEGYIDENGNPSVTKDTQLSTPIMNNIIDRAAEEFYTRNTDQVRAALARQQAQT